MSEKRIEYRVKYKGNGVDPDIKPGGSGPMYELKGDGTTKGAEEAAQDYLRFFNVTKKVSEKVEGGKNVKETKTFVRDACVVWIEEFHNGELVKTFKPEKLAGIAVTPKTGIEGSYLNLLKEMVVSECSRTEADADNLIRRHPSIVLKGIMAGLSIAGVRNTALAIEVAEANGEGFDEGGSDYQEVATETKVSEPEGVEHLKNVSADVDEKEVMASLTR